MSFCLRLAVEYISLDFMSCLFPTATNTNGGLNYNYDINRDKCIYLIHISYFFHYDISQKVNPKPIYYWYISKNI